MTLSYNISQISDVAKQLIAKVSSKTLCFYGEMGAGKTTLIKALVRENGELLGYHFDFYRLNDESEAWDLGLEEYLSGDTWVFMEWPEKIAGLLPPTRTEIRIEILDEKNRQLSVV